MAKDNKMWIDMCAGSELKDTQGETLSVEGADITDLIEGRGRFNDNHGKGFFNSLGRVTEAKKIIKSEDCENDRHKYYWEKIKAPFIYTKGYLFNNEDHPNAKAAAAILRNIHREDAPLVMKASVEGGVMARGVSDPTRLARTKIHSVALTFTPANNATLVEPLEVNKSNTDWEADKQLIKSVMHLAETNVPSFRHIQRHASANSIHDNILKIKEISAQLGIEVNIDLPEPEVIMKNAVFKKVENNVKKINELVKALKVNHMGLIGGQAGVSKLQSSPNTADGFSHPDVVNRWHEQGPIPETHPDYKEMVTYINTLKNTPSGATANANVSEAKRLYEAHIAKPSNIGKSDLTKDNAEIKRDNVKKQLKKALLAGYGGAGVPTNMVGGGVIQPQSLETKRKKKIKKTLVKAVTTELEELAKGKKELLAMYKDPAHGKDHVDWVTSTLPPAWHTWAVKNHRDNPAGFTQNVKEKLAHYGGMATHADAIKQVRFDSKDNFDTGFSKLQAAEMAHSDSPSEKRHVEPTEKTSPMSPTVKIGEEVGNWYSLNDSYDADEGKALNHCGNIEGKTRTTDNVLSLRSIRERDGKHKPHLTFIENNGWLGEMKAHSNSKPKEHHHEAIVELLKNPRIKGIAGGGYERRENFKFSDLSPEHQKEVLDANPSLVTDLDSYENQLKALSSGSLPPHQAWEMVNPNENIDGVDPRLHETLINNYPNTRSIIALASNLDPRLYEQLINDEDWGTRAAIAEKPNLDPHHHEQLVNDEDEDVRLAITKNPSLDPRHHEQLVDDEYEDVRQAIAGNPNLDPRHHEKLVNDEDVDTRKSIAANPNLDPRLLVQLMNDKDKNLSEIAQYYYRHRGLNSLNKKLYELKEALAKSLEYITCDNCGHEQVFMPHQVKCRECKQNFSLYRLGSAKS